MSDLPKLPDLVVLIAEPSQHTRRILREILIRCGIKRIVEATDGADAISQYTTLLPDLVIIEWGMPFLSGEDFIRLARTSPETSRRDTPIILTLAEPSKSVVTLAIRLGIHDIVVKPMSPKSLCTKIESALKRSRDAQRNRLKSLRGGTERTAPIAATG
jgi:PleD family two-component response regulator